MSLDREREKERKSCDRLVATGVPCHATLVIFSSLSCRDKKYVGSVMHMRGSYAYSLLCCQWNGNHGASTGRLYYVSTDRRNGGWSAQVSNKRQWLEADLGETTTVTMVATQGRYDYDQWVKSFKVAYSKYGSHFEFQDKVNTDIIKYTTSRVLNHFDLGKGPERIYLFL